jgi:hypothetical protein
MFVTLFLKNATSLCTFMFSSEDHPRRMQPVRLCLYQISDSLLNKIKTNHLSGLYHPSVLTLSAF